MHYLVIQIANGTSLQLTIYGICIKKLIHFAKYCQFGKNDLHYWSLLYQMSFLQLLPIF